MGLYKSWIFKQNWIISIRSRFIKFLLIWPDPIHWPTQPPTDPPNHPSRGVGVSTNHKSSNNWIISTRSRFIKFLLIWPDPTHWPNQTPTDPPNYPYTHPWVGCLYKSWNFKQNWIISIRSRFMKFLLICPDPIHWPNQPPTDPPNHPSMGVGVSTNHKSSNNWIISTRSRFIKFLLIWPDPTHWPTKPPTDPLTTHTPIHGWAVSTNHTSPNRIELSWFGQDLFNF